MAFPRQINYYTRAGRLRSVLCNANGLNATASHHYAMYVKGKHSVFKIHHHAVRVGQGTQSRKSPLATSADLDTGLRVFAPDQDIINGNRPRGEIGPRPDRLLSL